MVLTKIVGGCPSHEAGNAAMANGLTLAVGPKKPSNSLQLQLHPFSSEHETGGLIVKIQPPREPEDTDLHHVPCDLVLSIDISGSMADEAPAPSKPGEEAGEDTGLRVIDLVKHAARTIVATLDSRDRLGIVTFTTQSKVLQPLMSMTDENKAKTLKNIEDMEPLSSTNMWHGIRDGLGLFSEVEGGSTGRVPALLVLTDGMPNHMCPPKGYVPMLRSMEPLPATIHTFGFGYELRSGLLKSIAEVGGGNYSFIPDAGMLGTVFIHAVAHLQSTFANNAKLRLTYPSYLKLEEMTGEAVGRQEPVELEGDVPEPMTSLTIPIDNIQYGQSRDICLHYGNPAAAIRKEAGANPPPAITAVLEYQHFSPTVHQAVAHQSPFASTPSLDPGEIAHHLSRAALIAFLATLSPLNVQHEHEPRGRPPTESAELLQSLVASLPATSPKFTTTPGGHAGCRSLLTDICGAPVPTTNPSSWTGQVALALLDPTFYHRWGRHYLASLAGAHARQACNSFKDAGPLQYGVDSPLFQRCRDRLDKAFDSLPPPVPPPVRRSGPGGRNQKKTYTAPVSMARYNHVGNGCFAGCSPVLLAGGKGVARINRLRAGMEVVTPRGPRKVAAVLRMPVRRAEMCLVAAAAGPSGKGRSRLLVTPWHPVELLQGGKWVFPRDHATRSVRYTGAVYSVLLERDEDADAHAILVGGVWGVTMGHGLATQVLGRRYDVRVHEFYGVYDAVSKALARLPQRAGGVAMGAGLTRDPVTGKVNGFSAVKAEEVKALGMRQRGRGVFA
ncbi:hint-domain-containing protein [Chaetomium tenue]|uniref:Hint-domain-containing protein n=1 Tax=Chaetomium tenue TaxID=1854479 RepID=A0ACB7NYZ6_9PEZI|nr:hint-domain-containing protein [Chaetomium globosum]